MIDSRQILIVVVLYNPEENIIDRFSLNNYHYLIIDNSSQSNPKIQTFCSEQTRCRYLPMNDNLGLPKAFNIACEYAISEGFQWIITMDQDSTLTEAIVEKMLAFANRSSELDKIAIISPRHVLQEGKKVYIKNEELEYIESPNTMASGNLLNLTVWRAIGGFDESIFIDMFDIDYYFNAIINGYKVIVLVGVEMKHQLGNLFTVSFFGKKYSVLNHIPLRKYYQARNSLYLIKKYSDKKISTELAYKLLLGIFISTLFFEKNKMEKIKYIGLGFLDFFRRKMGRLAVNKVI